jgi:UDP-N-acetylmuramate--alanine ligase
MSGGFEGRKLHLVGIGGAGMSGLALAANELGAEVSGSDREASSYTERLEAAGVRVSVGHDAANVPAGAEVVRSTAIGDENPELAAARDQGLRIMHRSELLAELAAVKPVCITVAGTHGKTTTTAMIAHVLDRLGLESDGSFVRYQPQIAVITNIEFEHAETWSGLDELIAAFAQHVAPADHVVVSADQPRSSELGLGDRATTFALAPQGGDFVAAGLETPNDPSAGTSFRLGEIVVALGVRGEHNVKNSLAALAALSLAGIGPERAAPELESFTGVARRFERVGSTAAGTVVYDDYAHHPTEVRAALATARGAAGSGRVIAVYQPHLYSRTKALRRETGEALALADVVVVLDVYPARERAEDFPGVTGWLAATAAADADPGKTVYYEPTLEDAEQLLGRILRPDDLCITIGAGTVTRLAHELVGESA